MKSVLLVLLSINLSFAQYEKTFIPSMVHDTIPPEVYHGLKKRLVQDKAGVAARGREGDYLRSLYDQRFEYVVNIFNDGYLMPDHPLTTALRRVADRIYLANPALHREVNVYAYRSSVPNAVSFGDGTICIMLGLLERLETEDQLAYILCHEFVHDHAGHADENFARLAALNYDKQLKQKISHMRSSPYGRYSQLKALFHSLDLSVNQHKRKSEFEADSLALLYYLKTGYDRYAPLQVMQILENADRGLYKNNVDFRKHFSFTAFPFKESWTAYSTSNLVYASSQNEEADTLRTHPDCRRRFERLQHQLQIAQLDSARLRPNGDFGGFRLLASFEIVNSDYHFRQYGKALFCSLQLADSFPANPYLGAMIAKSLFQLYRAQRDHSLDEVLEFPDPRYEESYNRFLTFLNKLRLHELANLAYQYATTRPAEFYSNEEMIHALWKCSAFEFSKVDGDKVAQEYARLFPEGKYIREMKNKK